MTKDAKIGDVAMANEICFICCTKTEIILIQSSSRIPEGAKPVKELHGEIIGYRYCDDCEKLRSKGIVVVETKDDDKDYRTGRLWVITEDAFKRMVNNDELQKDGLKQKIVLMSESACSIIGFP